MAIDNTGQFTMLDRADIICDQTKHLFIDSTTKREALGYFLQFTEQICDAIVFMIIDGSKNNFWRNVSEFRTGSKGTPLFDKIYKSSFWIQYLDEPELKYIPISQDSTDFRWVPKMLKLEAVRAFVLVPVKISPRLLGVAIGGSTSAMQLKDEMDTLQKLQLITDCTLTILRCRRTIQEIE